MFLKFCTSFSVVPLTENIEINVEHWNKFLGSCVVLLLHGTILQQWASLLNNSPSIEKRKNLARDCWRIVPVRVEESCQWLLNNRTSDCWRIMPEWLLKNRVNHCWRVMLVTVEELWYPLLKNHASDCWRIVLVTAKQSCQWLLKYYASDCWRIVPVTVEQSCQ